MRWGIFRVNHTLHMAGRLSASARADLEGPFTDDQFEVQCRILLHDNWKPEGPFAAAEKKSADDIEEVARVALGSILGAILDGKRYSKATSFSIARADILRTYRTFLRIADETGEEAWFRFDHRVWDHARLKAAASKADDLRCVYLATRELDEGQLAYLEQLAKVFDYPSGECEGFSLKKVPDRGFEAAAKIIRALRCLYFRDEIAPEPPTRAEPVRGALDRHVHEWQVRETEWRLAHLRRLYGFLAETEEAMQAASPSTPTDRARYEAKIRRKEILDAATGKAMAWDERNPWAKSLAVDCLDALDSLFLGVKPQQPRVYGRGKQAIEKFLEGHFEIARAPGLIGTLLSTSKTITTMGAIPYARLPHDLLAPIPFVPGGEPEVEIGGRMEDRLRAFMDSKVDSLPTGRLGFFDLGDGHGPDYLRARINFDKIKDTLPSPLDWFKPEAGRKRQTRTARVPA